MAKDKELSASKKQDAKSTDTKKAAKADAADKQLPAESKKQEAKKKDSKKDNANKQGKIAKWFKDLKLELKKVVWPSRQTVVNNSIVVFAAMLGCALITFLLDQGFLWLFQFAISGGSGNS